MKRIFLVLGIVLLSLGVARSQDHDLHIDFSRVDSINIKLIDWWTTGFGYYGINRYQFDDAFSITKANRDKREYKSISLFEITIKDKMSVYLFITILNRLEPYKENKIKMLPAEVMERSKANTTKDGFMSGYSRNDDPIETRGKMVIFMQKEEIIAYMSRTTIDIFNYSYKSGIMGDILTGIYKLNE